MSPRDQQTITIVLNGKLLDQGLSIACSLFSLGFFPSAAYLIRHRHPISALPLDKRLFLFVLLQLAILFMCRMVSRWAWKREFVNESAISTWLTALAFGTMCGWAGVSALEVFFVHFYDPRRKLIATAALAVYGASLAVIGAVIALYNHDAVRERADRVLWTSIGHNSGLGHRAYGGR